MLILSLGHTPLPQPDFHNVRHHDGTGEVCPYHDHLLRWHPGADAASDVALLHWHWLVPSPGRLSDPEHDRGPALHANASDWAAMAPDSGPQFAPTPPSARLAARLAIGPPLAFLALDPPPPGLTDREGRPRPGSLGARLARGGLAPLLQRWTC